MNDLLIAVGDAAMALSPGLILWSMASILAAALLRGFTGFGFALAAVPLLGLFMSPTEAVPLAIAVQLFGSLMDFRSSSQACHWPSLRWLMTGAVIGSPLGTLLLVVIPAPVARLVISAITLFAVLIMSRGFTLVALPPRIPTAITGFLAGFFNGLAAMPGPPVVAYYMSVPLPRGVARASLMMFFLMTTITATVASAAVGMFTLQILVLALLGLPVLWLGTWAGEYAFTRGTDVMHRRVSVASLGVIALVSAVKGVGELV